MSAGRATLAAVLLVALALRLWRLDAYPAGLSHDEAYDALNALDVLAGRWPVFFESNNGREALFMYPVAASFALFGVGTVPLRLVSALAGTAAVALVYLLGVAIVGRRVGLLAGALMAVSFWPLFDSRVGLRASLIPALATLLVLALWRWCKDLRGLRWPAIAGVALGLSLHAYTPARFLPLVPLALAAHLWLRRGASLRALVPGLGVLTAAAAIVFSPLGLYFLANPDSFASRAGQVNDFRFILRDGNFAPLVEDTLNTLGMFTFRGDPFDRYNLADRPVFDLLTSLFFYAGLVVAPALVSVWLAVGLLPSAITGESPHFLRAIAAQPAAYLLAALGFWAVVDRVRLPGRVAATAATLLVGFVGALAARDYFVLWNEDPEARRIYNAPYAEIAAELAAEPSVRTFVGAEYPADLDRFVVDVSRGLVPYRATWLDTRTALVLPEQGGFRYLVPRTVRPPEPLLASVLHGLPGRDVELARVHFPMAATAEPTRPLAARLGDALELIGYDAPIEASPGSMARVVLHWRVIAPPPPDLSFFVHAVGDLGTLWGQNDGLGYPPDQWQVGDRLIHWHDVEVPIGTPPVELRLEAGGYTRRDGRRLPVVTTGAPDDRLRLGALRVSRTPDQTVPRSASPVEIAFGDAVALRAYELAQTPSELRLTLFWQAARSSLFPDHTVFVHLVGPRPEPVSQGDAPPAAGMYPTSRWQAGDLIRDVHAVPLPPSLAPGRYRLLVGLYRPDNGARLAPNAAERSVLGRARIALSRRIPLWAPPHADGDRVLLATISR